MQETVLYQDEKRLKTAGDKLICLTFLTTHPDSIKKLIYLPAQAYYQISELFPDVIFYSLSYVKDNERVPFYDMKISFVSLPELLKLERLCMALELNDTGERIADIDVHIFFRQSKKLHKVTRKNI